MPASPGSCAAPMASPRTARKDYYVALGVTPDATITQIKKAYRALAQRYHPDRVSREREEYREAVERMVEINEAFAVVSDVKKRTAYGPVARGPRQTGGLGRAGLSGLGDACGADTGSRRDPGPFGGHQ